MGMSCGRPAVAVDQIIIQPGKQTECCLDISYERGSSTVTETVHFLLFVPQSYLQDQDRWPLLLFLHGLGECGTAELDRVKLHGPPHRVEHDPDFPFILVSPQHPPVDESGDELQRNKRVYEAWSAPMLTRWLDRIEAALRVDADRLYVTGLSMGGFGTWRLAAYAPDRFAAVAPICGGGQISSAPRLKGMPIWCFHGALDDAVPLRMSQEMVDAVRAAGGDARLTVYPETGHDSWVQAYNTPELYTWFLTHRTPHDE